MASLHGRTDGSRHPTPARHAMLRTMTQPASGRDTRMDVVKAFGVIAIILAHSEPPAFMTQVVSTFYIAVFFFVSGYFYKDTYSDNLHLLASRRLKSLYVPFVAWNLGYLALHNAFFALNLYSSRTGYLGTTSRIYDARAFIGVALGVLTLRSTEQMAGALWFVASLLTVFVLFGLVNWASRRMSPRYSEHLTAIAALLLFAVGYANQQWLAWPMFLNTSLVAMVVFYAGRMYRRGEARIPITLPLAGIAVAVMYFGRGTVNLGSPSPVGPVGMLLVAFAGIYSCLYVAALLRANRLLGYLGRNSLAVIATHFLAFKLVSLFYVQSHGLPIYMLAKFPVVTGAGNWWAVYFMCGILVPLLVVAGAKGAWAHVRDRFAAKPAGASDTTA